MTNKFKTSSAEETRNLGYKVGKCITMPSVILLDGDLAAGKTTFSLGLAKALGVKKVVNSPSFTIMKSYTGEGVDLHHLDLYRLDSVGYDFDLEDYLVDGIAVIEWPFQVEEVLPEEYLLIKIDKGNLDERTFTFIPKGSKYEGVLKCIG